MFNVVYPAILNQQCCGIGGGGGPPEFSVSLETFIVDFNEFTRYADIPSEASKATSVVTGDQSTVLNIDHWLIPSAGAPTPQGSYYGDGDFLASFPGIGIFAAVFIPFGGGGTPKLAVEVPMNKTLLTDPAYPDLTVQYLHGITFKYTGQIRLEIKDTGEGFDSGVSLAPLNGWQQTASFNVTNLDGLPLANNLYHFLTNGVGVQEYGLDEIEITIGTRTLL
jgi:hypothetical protein